MAEKRERKGRRKIPMRRIEGEEDRLITFSKRRNGIYKKASEISTLCGVDVGVLMFSPAGKPFSFGIPDLESISGDLMRRDPRQGSPGPRRNDRVEELNAMCDELTGELQSLKKEGEKLVAEGKKTTEEEGGAGWWWDIPVEDFMDEEMEKMNETMEVVKKNSEMRLDDLMAENAADFAASSSAGFMDPAGYDGAGGFSDALAAFGDDGYGNGY